MNYLAHYIANIPMCRQCVEYITELRELRERLDVIEQLDWVKSQLYELDNKARYIDIIRNVKYKAEIERIMRVPFRRAPSEYFRLSNTRNAICHPFTELGLRIN